MVPAEEEEPKGGWCVYESMYVHIQTGRDLVIVNSI